jgi:hypothetical protein
MADQKRWWKLWCSMLTDDDIMRLDPADRWRWVALGAYIKQHGERGKVVISRHSPTIAAIFGVDDPDIYPIILRMPNVTVEEGKSVNGKLTVTFHNWHKYQEDSTASERVTRLRSKRRGEENKNKRENKIVTHRFSSLQTALENPDLRAALTPAFPGVSWEREGQKMLAWVAANPHRTKKDWPRFINSWLAKANPTEPTHGSPLSPAARLQLERERSSRSLQSAGTRQDPPAIPAGRSTPERVL